MRDGADGDLRTTAGVASALTLAVLPVFLLGASSDAIGAELGISETAIGAAITVLFVSVGVTATSVGRLTERLGGGTALRAGVLLSATATAGIGVFAGSWWQLASPLVLVGAAIGLVDTGGARAFADRVTPGRQGTAFGIKEASVPAASLLAGLGLPTLAVWLGWRATFVAAPVLAVLVVVALPRMPAVGGQGDAARHDRNEPPTETAPRGEDPAAGSPKLLRFAIGVGLGAGAATAAATFLAPAFLARGLSPSAAGALLVVASVTSILGRLATGRWADRPGADAGRAVAVLLGIGGTGAVVLAAPAPPVLAAFGAVLVLGAGWGWTNLAFLVAVRARPDVPAVAAGGVLTGLGAGGALGPLVFGALASNVSYTASWVATATALLVACGLTASAYGSSAGAGRWDRSGATW